MSDLAIKDGGEAAGLSAQHPSTSMLSREVASTSAPKIRPEKLSPDLLDTPDPDPPNGELIGPTNPETRMTVTVMLRSKASDQEIDDTIRGDKFLELLKAQEK